MPNEASHAVCGSQRWAREVVFGAELGYVNALVPQDTLESAGVFSELISIKNKSMNTRLGDKVGRECSMAASIFMGFFVTAARIEKGAFRSRGTNLLRTFQLELDQ
jgi:hypothetical protein